MKSIGKGLILVGIIGIVGSVLMPTSLALVKRGSNAASFSISQVITTVHHITLYRDYNGSSWTNSTTINVDDGDSISSAVNPTKSNYTFVGWKTSAPTFSSYAKDYTTSELNSVVPNGDMTLYPIFKTSAIKAYTNGNYYDVDTDITLSTNSIGNTSMGYAYLGFDGIPVTTATWNSTRNLTTNSGIYQFRNVNGGAALYRKVGFSTEEDTSSNGVWKIANYNANGRGMWASDGSNGEEIGFTRIGSTERCYAYVPYQYNQFYIKNYSYQDNGQDLQSGKIQLSEGYSSTNWMLHKQGNWWSTWTIGGSQAYWGT